MKTFEQALINAELEKQEKAKARKAKAAYIADLTAQGIDKTMAKIMADAFFESGLVKAL